MLTPLTNHDFVNSNMDELVMHMGVSRRNHNSGRAFFKTICFDRVMGFVMIGYSNSTDYFVHFSNGNHLVTGPHYPVKTAALQKKLADLIERDLEFWYTEFPEAMDIQRDLHVVGVHNNRLILHYAPLDTHVIATVSTTISFDNETLLKVSPEVLNVVTKYLMIPGLLQQLNTMIPNNKRSDIVVNRINIKSVYTNNNNNRNVLSLMYKNQPLTFNTRNKRLSIPRNNTIGLTNMDRVVLEKYVKDHYVYNPNTRRIVDSSVKSFKPVLSVPNLSECQLETLSEFNRKHNGKKLIVDVAKRTAMFNGGALMNNNLNALQNFQSIVATIIDNTLPEGSDRRRYWNGNYNVIFRNKVAKDYTLYQDWHRDTNRQFDQSMYAFVIFFINGDDRYEGGELVCVRPRANQTVNKTNLVSCNPSASSGQAVILHALTGYHKVMPYTRLNNGTNNNNNTINRNMILIQLFTNQFMANEQQTPIGSVKNYANAVMKNKLNRFYS